MSTETLPTPLQRHLVKSLDMGMYMLAQVLVWMFIGGLVGIMLRDPDYGLTRTMFFAGMGLFLIAVIKLRPESAVERNRRRIAEDRGEENPQVRGWLPVKVNVSMEGELGSPLEQFLADLPPLSKFKLDPDERYDLGVKLFFSGAALWLIAYRLEQVLIA